MHGRTGDTPVGLRNLIDAADEFDDELIKMRDEGLLEEAGAMGETRHVSSFRIGVGWGRALTLLNRYSFFS